MAQIIYFAGLIISVLALSLSFKALIRWKRVAWRQKVPLWLPFLFILSIVVVGYQISEAVIWDGEIIFYALLLVFSLGSVSFFMTDSRFYTRALKPRFLKEGKEFNFIVEKEARYSLWGKLIVSGKNTGIRAMVPYNPDNVSEEEEVKVRIIRIDYVYQIVEVQVV